MNDLRRCYAEQGIVAGRKSKRFHQYWARHGFFASFGAMHLNDFEVVRQNLALFASMQADDGRIPNQISLSLKPRYKLLAGSVIDSTALFLVCLAEYVRQSKDKAFAEELFSSAKKAAEFLLSKDRDNDGLIEERVFANWAETVLKFGKVLYTNCCFYRALADFAFLCSLQKRFGLQKRFERLAERTKQGINHQFWEGNYYIDWVDFQRHNFFASDGNLLAIDFGIADKAQSQMILSRIKEKQLNKVPLQTNYPLYPFWRIPPTLLPLLEYNYHNGFSWPWLGCLNAIALNKVGWRKEARQTLRKVADLINENGIVHEVFNEKGKPVNSVFLKSERPFAWNAGFFVRAVNEVKKQGRV
jgi:glycogen debranching enzyme